MAAPTFVGVSGIWQATTVPALTVDVGLPTGWQPGDLSFLIASYPASTTIAPPTGWTQIAHQNAGIQTRLWAYRWLVTGDSGPTVTQANTSTAPLAASTVAFRGVSYPTAWESLQVNSGNGTSLSISPIVTTGAERLGVVLWMHRIVGGSTPPSGWTERLDAAGFSITRHIVDTREIPTATTVSGISRTVAISTEWGAVGFALLPGSGGPPDGPPSAGRRRRQVILGGAVGTLVGWRRPRLLAAGAVGCRRGSAAPARDVVTGNSDRPIFSATAAGAAPPTVGHPWMLAG